ncbi:hypothetical protein PYJP_02910 [Pyrofollis japonicus]|uniref:hypothetical protein n=1 Tax=Pyrofollis japonicus TaxID=3060460 RepID=UPI00295C387C|nr:hypothetical protein [Pyrofollis japonicus]BEP16939.1 hypothetical protein PYJP_02910 [Pyrofollis japonicus]
MYQERKCEDVLSEACGRSLSILEDISASIGKGRGKGSGIAKLLREAAYNLSDAASICIAGCEASTEPRCVLGDLVDRLQAVMQGAAIRLERIGKLQTDTEEELARIVVDLVYSLLDSLCRFASSINS